MFAKGEVLSGRYVIVKEIGSGSFAKVYCAFDEFKQSLVAIKFIDLNLTDQHLVRFEVKLNKIANEINPDNTVILLDDFKLSDNYHCLVLELMLFSLDQYPRSIRHRFLDFQKVKELGRQIFQALDKFSNISTDVCLTHADIKPQNIFIAPESWSVKIGDFGMSTIDSTETRQCGTIQYMAPEILCGFSFDASVDVWAAGCTIFELLTGVKLFNRSFLPDIIELIIETCGMPSEEFIVRSPPQVRCHFELSRGEWYTRNRSIQPFKRNLKYRLELESQHEEDIDLKAMDLFLDLLKDLLHWRPSERLTPSMALCHPFFGEDY